MLHQTPSAPIDLFEGLPGVGSGTTLADTSQEVRATAFDVNVHAHRWAAKYLVPEWLERGDGDNSGFTASAAGLLAQIGSGPYTLTERAAVAFAEWMSITMATPGSRSHVSVCRA